ncbi:unnamed protein product [Blepharisma stoltei]|uniref:Flap endonuclease 1 n=1 Tax=Blepharisma stoltei TaxID=1481888 RepID=A0AAU9K735_9CILI|nr:unnamed protein product [Blepharisma stoltei]
MGIKQLMQLINDKAPGSVYKLPLSRFSGQIVVCDASIALYQFLISTQFSTKSGLGTLTDHEGNPTAHLLGLLNRTLMLLENQIKPIWVFDGEPPNLKLQTISKRQLAKSEAEVLMKQAVEEQKQEDALKFRMRSVIISKNMANDAIKLLNLMGLPIAIAPGEAEAECAQLVKSGHASVVATEDMDSLVFGAPYLLRGFNSKKQPLTEICYEEMLNGLGLSHAEFVDMCILLGCDYTEHIEGVGPVSAYKLIKNFERIEKVLEFIKENKKYKIPENFDYEGARELFLNPKVKNNEEVNFQWTGPDEVGLKEFLVQGKGFAQGRVDDAVLKLKKLRESPKQLVLEHFFGKPIIKRKLSDDDTLGKKKPETKTIRKRGKKIKARIIF